MAKAPGKPADCEFLPARAGDIRDSLADISRAREVLGYEPVVDFVSGMGRMFSADSAGRSESV